MSGNEIEFKKLTEEISSATQELKNAKTAQEEKYRELHVGFDGLKADSEEIRAAVQKTAKEYAQISTIVQALEEGISDVKRQLDSPIHGSAKDLNDFDRKAALEFQREVHAFNGGHADEFKEDSSNLVNAAAYRSAASKIVKYAGLPDFMNRDNLRRVLDENEKKAFDNASLSSGFFSTQLLGLEVDCNIEAGSLLDLYGSQTVTGSRFRYPRIESYGDLGYYGCDAVCGADAGDPGVIRWLEGHVYDFRGAFCLQRKVIAESNFDILGFMIRAAQRSHRINRNNALIVGDGVNQPMGWLTLSETTDQGFRKRSTPQRGNPLAPSFTHQDYRAFIASYPVEYGVPTAVMHQNVFAYLATMVDTNGRFLFGDGDMTFSPASVRDSIRITNAVPDATEGLTRGNPNQEPFDPGAFLVALADWKTAYYVVNKRGLFMEQYFGGSDAWCVKYQFGAEDGGFIGCGPAGQILVVG